LKLAHNAQHAQLRNTTSRILIGLALLVSLLLPSLLPIGVQAGILGAGRDPVWNARLKDVPGWLQMPDVTSQLYSEFELPVLAGKLILFGTIDGSGCPGNGLNANYEANECGLQRALSNTHEWQNRFNEAILNTSKQSGIPPRMLKNIFAWESQFWPQTVYVNTYEYGLGHMTLMGADSTLRWNVPFYDSICAASFSPDTCKIDYADQPKDIQSALRGVVVQRVNADCPECTYLLDIPLAERSVSLFADTLLANASYVKMIIKDQTRRQPADVVAYADLWKFTLTSYNAGPGCFINAFSNLVSYHIPLNYENLAARLEPGCQGAVAYIEFVSNTDAYNPDHEPIPLPPVAPTGVPLPTGTIPVLTVTPEITVTLTTTATQIPETPTPSPTWQVSETPNITSTLSSGTPEVTSTPTPTPDGETATPTSGVETPTPTPTGEIATPTPEIETPTPVETPTPLTVTPTLTVTITPTLTVTPVITLTVPYTSTPTATVTPVTIDAPHASTEIVLKIDPQNQKAALQALQAQGIDLTKDISHIKALDWLVVQVSADRLPYVLAALQNGPGIIFAEPNYLVSADSLADDPEFPRQDNLSAVQAPQTWAVLPSMQEVLVAVIDSGVDVNHPDLVDQIWQNAGEVGLDANGNDKRANGVDDDRNGYVDDWQGWNLISANNNVIDTLGHGTHLAGIIGAAVDNSIGVAGVAPNARLLPVKALDDSGVGAYSRVAEGITYATDMGARIINLGFSGISFSEMLQSAIDYAVTRGVLVVAASGNNGLTTPNYPAGYAGVLAVTAVDNDGYWTGFPASGEHVSLAAPGRDVYSTSPGGFYRALSGTSQAAAHVAGIAALLAGQPQLNDVSILRNALLNSARDLGDPGRDHYFGFGMVQANNALLYSGLVLPTPSTGNGSVTQPGSGIPNTLTMLNLWGRTQITTFPVNNPGYSIDGAFNSKMAESTGTYGESSAYRWTFTSIDDVTTFPVIAAVYLELRFYMTGWVDDSFSIQVYEPTNPACPAGWCTVEALKINPTLGQPETQAPSSLTTMTIPVTSVLDTSAKVNAAQVRIAGTASTGISVDQVTIYVDEVRLRLLDYLPPTPTPTPTQVFIPTAAIPATRPATASPVAGEPHSNLTPLTADQCASCHRSHTAQGRELRIDGHEEQICFGCHTAGGSGTNVQPAFTSKTNTPTRFFSHGVSNTSMIHMPGETIGGNFGGANRHVECEDCHSPHSSSRSAVPGSNLAPAVQQEMYLSTGVEPLWTAAGAPAGFSGMDVAEREYQVCFKCHSSFTTLPTYFPDGYGWDNSSTVPGYIANGLGKLSSTNPAQVLDSRDLAKEFNSFQVSFHPLAAQGRNRNMDPGSFVSPWSRDSIVYCTDCHDYAGGDSDGPHGSPLLHLLDGASEYITQTDPGQNCAPGGCPSIHDPGELCFKCHQYNTYATGSNPVTTTRFRKGVENLHTFHSFGSCYTCHDSHGSEQDRLINFDTTVVSISAGYNSQTAWQFNAAANVGTCYVSCHAGNHGADGTKQYSP
jgi:thermitase